MGMTLPEAQERIGQIVLIWKANDRDGRPSHGKLIGLHGQRHGVVKPPGHGREEIMPLEKLDPWLKGQAEQEARIAKTRAAQPDRWVDAQGLVDAIRPGLNRCNVHWWRKTGRIPDDCTRQRKGAGRRELEFNLDALLRMGFHVPAKGGGKALPQRPPHLATAMEIGTAWRARDNRIGWVTDKDESLGVFEVHLADEAVPSLYNGKGRRVDLPTDDGTMRPDDLVALIPQDEARAEECELMAAKREPIGSANAQPAKKEAETVKIPAAEPETIPEPIPFPVESMPGPGPEPVTVKIEAPAQPEPKPEVAPVPAPVPAAPAVAEPATQAVALPAFPPGYAEAWEEQLTAEAELCELDAMKLELQAKLLRARTKAALIKRRAQGPQ